MGTDRQKGDSKQIETIAELAKVPEPEQTMGTDPQKGDSKQIETSAELAKGVPELEQEKPSVSRRRQEFETRIGDLESAMSVMKEQLSALHRDTGAHSMAVIDNLRELDESFSGAERSAIDTTQAADWLSALPESERAELRKKKEELDNILTSLRG
jgi:hypothetical protein